MAAPGLTIVQRIRSILGAGAVVETDGTGLPRVAPGTEEGVALVLRAAAADGWRVRIEGRGSWVPPDAPADLALTTRNLTKVPYLDPNDLVATAEAGIPLDDLRQALADRGTWLPADPPGASRSLGSVVATGTAGPLRGGFGNFRDHLLGVTIVTGDGRVVRPGGRVVKNVAGFDLTKLAAGSFGAFGVVTSVTLRLRGVPRADTTLVATGARDALLNAAHSILQAGITPAALELLSPQAAQGEQWMLAVRLIGADAAVSAERDSVSGATETALTELAVADASKLWRGLLADVPPGSGTLRLGALPSALDEALDLVAHHLPEGWLTVTIGAGVVRWSGDTTADRIKLLRHTAAQREMPLTLERATWQLRELVGHFGAYREGVGRLVGALRRTFDPAGVLVTAIGDEM